MIEEPGGQEPIAIPRGVVVPKFLPEPDYLDFSLAEHQVVVLTDDGTDATPAVARALAGLDWNYSPKKYVCRFSRAYVSEHFLFLFTRAAVCPFCGHWWQHALLRLQAYWVFRSRLANPGYQRVIVGCRLS